MSAFIQLVLYVSTEFSFDLQCWQHWWHLLPSFFWLLLFPPPRLHLAPSSLFSCFLLHFVALRCFLNHAYKYATQFFSITTRWQFTFGRGCRPHVPLPVFAFRFAIAIDNLCAEREREREGRNEREGEAACQVQPKKELLQFVSLLKVRHTFWLALKLSMKWNGIENETNGIE